MLHLKSRLRPRLFGSTVLAIVVYALLPQSWGAVLRFLVAWDVGIVCYLTLAGIMAARSTMAIMQKRAEEEDEKAVVFLILTLSAAVASLAAIGIELSGIHTARSQEAFRLAVAGVTILCSWLFVHTIYAIHYAHEYYGDEGERRGLVFPHDDKPDYWDFLYFSFNFGAAAQTSDVVIVSKRMRRLSLAHAMLAFLFNTTILALAVNVGAGLL
ncbi:DUF1345 domain-containing protein [Microvirga sp. TS319]|uniref:DUF1345 domain-containing protein n=1 Tax=Microvirga sp. TS319 TaxID=3241165 RepID=UPI00351A3C69